MTESRKDLSPQDAHASFSQLSLPPAQLENLTQLGYIEVENCEAEGWLVPGEHARGHEFRYSVIDPMPETIRRLYKEPAEGYRVRSVLGSYVHLHFLSCPNFAERFVRDCTCWRAQNQND